MKIILLLFALIFIAHGNFVNFVRKVIVTDTCIGIKDSYILEQKYALVYVCCDEPVDPKLSTYSVKSDESISIHDILDADYDLLTAGRTNCEKGHESICCG